MLDRMKGLNGLLGHTGEVKSCKSKMRTNRERKEGKEKSGDRHKIKFNNKNKINKMERRMEVGREKNKQCLSINK